jgi:choloylglycine hydrolase
MPRRPLLLLLTLLITLVLNRSGLACTTFVLESEGLQMLGRNYDWDMGEALLMVNKRGCRKRSVVRQGEKGVKATWTARYGSLTFNQFGRELPTGGMNEAGLVVEAMALSETRYPERDQRPYIGTAHQWRQYLLDTCATVAEVVAADKKVRISDKQTGPGIHVLVLDQKGHSALIEFLDGHMRVHRGSDLPVATATNDTYGRSLRYLSKDRAPLFDAGDSIARFITAAKRTRSCRAQTEEEMVSYAFKTLDAVSSGRTQWRIVYDNQNMQVHFRTRANSRLRWIDLSRLNFSRDTPVKIMDINADLAGDVTAAFTDYTYEANRKLIGQTYAPYGLSADRIDAAAKFPEVFECPD